MDIKIKPLLLKCDFIGFIPQFRILEETRYKSIFSSLLSIAIIIFSVAFAFYSFLDYLNQNPNVHYYKNNDKTTNKTFTISDSFLMFKNNFFCASDPFDNGNLIVSLNSPGEVFFEDVNYEPCELGKNLDIKYKDIIEEFERIEDTKISDYSCLNYNGTKFTLINNPYISNNNETTLEIRLESTCEDFILAFNLVTQNDFIEHKNKKNPIVPYYQKHRIITDNKFTNLIFYYNYIKYESDDGFIFSNKNIINGIGVSNTNSYDKREVSKDALYIQFKMNGASYDYYQRNFIKFQTFLAEVMSLINLLITISKIISEFLLNKKMNKDIIRYILTPNEVKENSITKEKEIHGIFDIKFKKQKNQIDKNKIDKNIKGNHFSESPRTPTISPEDQNNNSDNEKNNEKINNVMKNIKVNSIIKSFFCCKDKKTELINLCDDIIYKDICIERILKRLYLLENEFDILKNEKFFEIENIIDDLNKELNNKKTEKTLSHNNRIK